ncbi:carbon-monoxide dehydrogenase large subunit [Asanoa ishikariensis]|uniref:Xanthine dehydrogenase, molybdenum binding subunit apoprotein n=1 Tax=Asanoa ishikariensis TaxID=137265 RepID=A0A1H3NIL1_9ACTN|nr:xanthine dehydrogenase family protein molybdopterin-binding subunit [Asanoa ishikariensis]GIF68616.1 carbon-monoxide dehydrogenase large subunit [Asanoa ishikariensis]SDY88275.1 xanthine dehydrogenase, molybdenum binding subunit apoprotein [Asanoa ishikariensis]
MSPVLGKPVNRVDGPDKVTGTGRYCGEIVLPGLAYGLIVGADVAKGRVVSIDESAARAAGGVYGILTHRNTPKVANAPHLIPSLAGQPAPGESFFPMQDDVVHYWGQPVALVVADSLESAAHAAALLDITYEESPAVATIEDGRKSAYEAETLFGGLMPARDERGDVTAALAAAEVTVDASYRYAANHHNPLETSVTTAQWDGDRLTLWDSTMGVRASQLTVASLLGIPLSDVRVITHFVGGGFGSKAMVWPHVTLAAMAARHVGRPVRLTLTRPQSFTSNGHREEQEQRITLGAGRDGRLTAIRHQKLSITSSFDDWAEPATGVSTQIYGCDNYLGSHSLIKGNTMTPTFTRAPGESLGSFSLETAMDRLAYELGMDPVELRIMNHPPVDNHGNPWSSDGMADCLRRGAELIGWADRDPTPGVRQEGDNLIGTGVAGAGYPVAFMMPVQHARARIFNDGSVVIQTSAQEFGIGVTTSMSQVGADGLGVDMDVLRFEAGDTDLPNTTSAVGSMGATMQSSAVHNAARTLRNELIAHAVADDKSPLHGLSPSSVRVADGRMTSTLDPSISESYADMLQRNRLLDLEALGSWTPPPFTTPHGLLTFGAQFAEVAVDKDLGLVRVRRMAGVFAPGRVLNPKLARSQLLGGMLWGLGQALLEGNQIDRQSGRWALNNLGEYLVPVHADIPDIQVEFVEVEDDVVGPLGVKGVGEVGQVGAAAAIANAVFHATGRRMSELPMTAEVVMNGGGAG